MIVDLFMWFVIVDFSDAVCDRRCLWVFIVEMFMRIVIVEMFMWLMIVELFMWFVIVIVYVVCHCDFLCYL